VRSHSFWIVLVKVLNVGQMKKITLSIFLSLLCAGLFAQSPSYVDFEWDVLRFGYAASSADAVSGGLSFGTEVRYNATDRFSIGLGTDGYVFGTDFDGDADLGVSSSSMIYGDYYLRGDSPQRGFVGLGFGMINTGTLTIRNGNVDETVDGVSGLGIAPRIGYEFGHVRLQGVYNLALKKEQSNYFGLSVALTLWGGYKGDSASN